MERDKDFITLQVEAGLGNPSAADDKEACQLVAE
jgi:hypothetical protein